MNIRLIYKTAVAALMLPAAMLFSSCDEEYLTFDTENPGIYFTRDTLEYSFGVTPIEINKYTFNVPVRIMSVLSDEARPIGYVVNPEKTTAVEGVHYEFGEAVILPNSIEGYIPVTFLRDNLNEIDEEGNKKRYELSIRLVGNGYFEPTLDELSQVRLIKFDDRIEQPNWLIADGSKKWPEAFGSWHPFTFIKIVEYFHALEDVLPETYMSMVKSYGENLENIPQGDINYHLIIFRKHIILPLYEYINNADNREEILKKYPDYPFDVPHPYGA
ncbi:MAG: DUF4843 domain-containing protein [Bacteroidaceae bacterium]|nr:DUF4843 domain-containing protein [Bacteroidaceae bacterium]